MPTWGMLLNLELNFCLMMFSDDHIILVHENVSSHKQITHFHLLKALGLKDQ